MTLLSKIIKSRTGVQSEIKAKVIEIKDISCLQPVEEIDETDPLEQEKKLILEKFQQQAHEIIQRAEQEALLIKNQTLEEKQAWNEEKALLIEEAKAIGFQQGLTEGQQQGFAQYNGQLDMVNQMTADLKGEYVRYIESAEKVILDLGMKVAERILHETIEEQPEKFLNIVKEALKEVKEHREVHILVHPTQYSFVIQCKDELDAIFPSNQQCYVYADDELSEFQCLIETSHGRVDASVDSQLTELKVKLMEFVEGETI